LFGQAKDPDAFVLAAGWLNDEALAAHPTHPDVPGVLALVRPLLASHWQILPTRRVSENRI
jgi:quinol monooxygenase YgiN